MPLHATDERTEIDGDPSGDGARLALVLSGGGSKGALQVGLYRALAELGVRPDFVLGTSVGALNAAFIAGGHDPDALADGWAGLSFRRLFGFNWRILFKGTSAQSLFSPGPLRRLLEDRLSARRFEELDTKLFVVTTHMETGEACVTDEGDIVGAVITSCSIPGILPPVLAHDGIPHIDGSLADNLPVDLAFERGATHVIAMNSRTCAACAPRATNLRDVLGAAFGIAADCKLRIMEDEYREDDRVLLLQPELGERVPTLDFSRGRELVEQGYAYAAPRLSEWLEARPELRARVEAASASS
ncbi:MAG: patatin-like phospholipase family protein [Gemmatimonadota bacterium]|nr:patatin-like phospholipase family protein [Gemmatimonadota bacterium]